MKCGIGHLVKEDGNYTTSKREMTAILNIYFFFTFAFTETNCASIHPFDIINEKLLDGLLIVESDVLRSGETVKINKSSRPDQISPRILNEVKHGISNLLSVL